MQLRFLKIYFEIYNNIKVDKNKKLIKIFSVICILYKFDLNKDINKIKLEFENQKHTGTKKISKISEEEIENVLEKVAEKSRIEVTHNPAILD